MVTSTNYAGDITSAEAWAILEQQPDAQLVDVRTIAEWTFVGLPDLSSLNRDIHCVEWQSFPAMSANPDFVAQTSGKMRTAGANEQSPLLFLCRSGGRSRAAAIAMAGAGFSKSFNIAGGFEGDLDQKRHRGVLGGWKAAGLPWRQS